MALGIETFRGGPLDNNSYVLYDEELGLATVIDPSFEAERLVRWIAARGLQVEAIVNTHGHFDHVAGNAAVRALAPQAPIYLHPADGALLIAAHEQAGFFSIPMTPSPKANRPLAEGREVVLAGQPWQVLHVPGHSPGSVALYARGSFIGGDVLFRGSIGRTDMPGGDGALLLAGIHQKVLVLPDETVVYPGHGPITTIGWERKSNPFLHRA